MPPKLKPSVKEYVRDANNKMTKKWFWKHITPYNTNTEELLKMYEGEAYKRKKNIIKRELIKRNAI